MSDFGDDDDFMHEDNASEDYDFEYEDDDGDEPDVDQENKYYNAKGASMLLNGRVNALAGRKEDEPEAALAELREVVQMEDEKGDWYVHALHNTCMHAFVAQGIQGAQANDQDLVQARPIQRRLP